jgi:MarR-like DNA-binding transcriptional regulator SgrR of sgrS sRNA
MADNKNSDDRNQYFQDRAGTDEANFHVVPNDEEGWAVKKEGEDEPELTTGSKSEAVDKAKEMAEEAGTMAIIHNDEGTTNHQENYRQ